MSGGMMRDYFVKMAENNAWANDVLSKACQTLSPEVFWATRPGFFGSIGKTLNHIYEIDLYYVDALEAGGKGRSVYDREDSRDAGALFAAQHEVDVRLIRFATGLTEAMLSERRETERADGVTSERVDWLFLHLIQHDVHHRGQVHAMLSDAGVKPPQLDDFYLEHGRVDSAKVYWESRIG